MNILHTLPLPRSTWRLAALLCLLLAALTLSPTLVSANSPPGTPSSVTVTRAEGMLTATWPAVADATGYDITYSSDGESWAVAALNYSKATITFRVKNSATYVVAVRARNAHGDSSWRKSSPSGPFVQTNPPEAPSSVTLTRSVGTLTATWPAVSDAADYHVTYTWNGGKSWNLAAINYPGTSITIINASNVSTYMVAVRARNSAGYSDWRSSDPIAPISPPVLAPDGLTATADDKSVTLKWRGSSESRVAGYEYQYRQATGGTGWSAWTAVPGSTISTTSFTKTGLTNDIEYRFKLRAVNADGAGPPAPQKPPFYVAATPFSGVTIPTPPGPPPPLAPEWVSVTRADGTLTATWPARERAYAYHIAYTSDSGSSWTLAALYHPATTITIDGVSNNATYVVAVRARGDNGDSDWTRSAPIAPLNPDPEITFTNVTATTATLNLANHNGAWYYKQTAPTVGTCSTVISAGTNSKTITGLDKSASYTFGVYSDNGCSNVLATASLTTLTPSLAVSNVGTSTLTLTLSNWDYISDGHWFYTHSGQNVSCTYVGPSLTANVTGLTTNTFYNFSAHTHSSCNESSLIATTNLSTTGVSVGNLGEPHSAYGNVGSTYRVQWAAAFTTGAATNGYTLAGVTLRFGNKSGNPGNISVALHTPSGGNPATSSLATLSGSNPDTAGLYTYDCSTGCDLSANSTYFVVVSAPNVASNSQYLLGQTASGDEVRRPAGNGWSIADSGRFKVGSNAWSSSNTDINVMHVSANVKTQGSPNMNATLLRGD